MSETPPEFDLKFLPDWLKAGPSENRYANYEGESRRGDRDDRRGPRGDRGGDRRGPRPAGGGDRRGPRPGGPGGPGGPRPGGPRREGGPRGREGRPDDRGRQFDRNRPPQPPIAPANVRIEFLPEPSGAQSIARQVKQSSRAYPLFSTGRLFLERPERHRVRITSLDSAAPLFQIGDGPVSFDRTFAERNAFRDLKAQYYVEETTQGEPLKGNYTNVARTRTSGILLGPTNYHGYQPALRKIYEERYSRRMSFQEFTQREIEIVSDEQAVNDWKEQARSVTTFTTTKEAEPIVLKSAFEAEQHFRKTYLPQLVKTGLTLESSGVASRSMPERSLGIALREAWEKERGFPAQLVNHLRPYLLEAGLHFFKHRKRVLYISAIKPLRVTPGQDMAAGLSAILAAVEASPKLTRRDLAAKILGENHEAPEMIEQKAQLARDLHYLVHAGHVIEFHDGTLDLPLPPGGQQPQQQQGKAGQKQGQKGQAPVAAAGEAAVEEAEEAADVETAEALVASPTEAAASSEALTADTPAPDQTSVTLTSDEGTGETLSELPATSEEQLPPSLSQPGTVDEESMPTIVAAPIETTREESAEVLASSTESPEAATLASAESLVTDSPVEVSAPETTAEPAAVPAEASSVTEALQEPNA
ncbi:hypothetical protein ACXR0O_26550 [Verrucomicrobiota bacterium sgz303538]